MELVKAFKEVGKNNRFNKGGQRDRSNREENERSSKY